SNKVMKHGFIEKMENIIDKDLKVSHEAIAQQLEGFIAEPSKLDEKIKVAKDSVESCFPPVIQSGGKYDIRNIAGSNKDNLSFDIIICSLGARYKNVCSNISRTFMIDAPDK